MDDTDGHCSEQNSRETDVFVFGVTVSRFSIAYSTGLITLNTKLKICAGKSYTMAKVESEKLYFGKFEAKYSLMVNL